jgi:hypothetical protein
MDTKWILAGIALLLLGGFVFWWWSKPDIRKGYRLWGTNTSTGAPCASAAVCQKNCQNEPGATGFAQWKAGATCWCVKPPYLDPKWTEDEQWESGVFKK